MRAEAREGLLLVVSTAVAVAISLLLVRLFAPQWLGLPADLGLVRLSKAVPPFFDNVFRAADQRHDDYILQDPRLQIRARQFLPSLGTGGGPNDLLGFRNAAIPVFADVLTIGDSQTYGRNATLHDSWPQVMARRLLAKEGTVYSMATGGWGGVQYLDMFIKGLAFRPRVVVVAYYSGNDPIDSYRLAYGVDHWRDLRPFEGVTDADLPDGMAFPPPEATWWVADLGDSGEMTFTPAYRYLSNDLDFAAVRAGWGVMESSARVMADIASKVGVKLVFTVIPTKELAYAPVVARAGVEPSVSYRELVEAEAENIEKLRSTLVTLGGNSAYVDVVSALQQAALDGRGLYPRGMDGHPLAAGYRAIADSLGPVVGAALPDRKSGLMKVGGQGGLVEYAVARDGEVWYFPSPETAVVTGWALGDAQSIARSALNRYVQRGYIQALDKKRFGPITDE